MEWVREKEQSRASDFGWILIALNRSTALILFTIVATLTLHFHDTLTHVGSQHDGMNWVSPLFVWLNYLQFVEEKEENTSFQQFFCGCLAVLELIFLRIKPIMPCWIVKIPVLQEVQFPSISLKTTFTYLTLNYYCSSRPMTLARL